MLRNRNHIVAGSLLAATFMLVAFSQQLVAEEYVWARFYGSSQPPGYATNGFGSYYVPKSMVTSKLQTDPIRKPAAEKLDATNSADPAVESQSPKRVSHKLKCFWKRLTFQN